jgi:hypothetical protein
LQASFLKLVSHVRKSAADADVRNLFDFEGVGTMMRPDPEMLPEDEALGQMLDLARDLVRFGIMF